VCDVSLILKTELIGFLLFEQNTEKTSFAWFRKNVIQ
jgi:hypothetical protein